jgi:hypothetical protein
MLRNMRLLPSRIGEQFEKESPICNRFALL